MRQATLIALAVTLAMSLSGNVWFAVRRLPRVINLDVTYRVRDPLPKLTGHWLAGPDATLTMSRPTVIYVFSPGCGWCRLDRDNLLSLHAAQAASYDFVAVTKDDDSAKLASYLAKYPIPVSVFVTRRDALTEDDNRKLGVTPQTIVVDRNGRVVRIWVGALFEQRQEEAQRFFGIRLPGVSEKDRLSQ